MQQETVDGAGLEADAYDRYVRAEWELFARDPSRSVASRHAVLGLAVTRVLDLGCGAGQELLPFLAGRRHARGRHRLVTRGWVGRPEALCGRPVWTPRGVRACRGGVTPDRHLECRRGDLPPRAAVHRQRADDRGGGSSAAPWRPAAAEVSPRLVLHGTARSRPRGQDPQARDSCVSCVVRRRPVSPDRRHSRGDASRVGKRFRRCGCCGASCHDTASSCTVCSATPSRRRQVCLSYESGHAECVWRSC